MDDRSLNLLWAAQGVAFPKWFLIEALLSESRITPSLVVMFHDYIPPQVPQQVLLKKEWRTGRYRLRAQFIRSGAESPVCVWVRFELLRDEERLMGVVYATDQDKWSMDPRVSGLTLGSYNFSEYENGEPFGDGIARLVIKGINDHFGKLMSVGPTQRSTTA